MAGVAVASPKQQFLDGAGMPLAMGFVNTYLAGTSTMTTTWKDRAQLVENQNPIPLDAFGAAIIYLDPLLTYRFEVLDAQRAIQPHLGGDNISGAGNTADLTATILPYLQQAQAAEAAAELARDQANVAAITKNTYPNTAQTNVPRGLTQASVGAITPGAGGTNGTFNIAWSAGNFAINPTGTFTVAGGVLTAVTITGPGQYIGAAPTVPTPSFTASAGLAGAAVALTAQFLIPSGEGYWTSSADGTRLQRYKNVAGVATSDTANIPDIPAYPALTANYAAQEQMAGTGIMTDLSAFNTNPNHFAISPAAAGWTGSVAVTPTGLQINQTVASYIFGYSTQIKTGGKHTRIKQTVTVTTGGGTSAVGLSFGTGAGRKTVYWRADGNLIVSTGDSTGLTNATITAFVPPTIAGDVLTIEYNLLDTGEMRVEASANGGRRTLINVNSVQQGSVDIALYSSSNTTHSFEVSSVSPVAQKHIDKAIEGLATQAGPLNALTAALTYLLNERKLPSGVAAIVLPAGFRVFRVIGQRKFVTNMELQPFLVKDDPTNCVAWLDVAAGLDTNPGTEALPFKSFPAAQKAIFKALNGTIYAKGGEYFGANALDTSTFGFACTTLQIISWDGLPVYNSPHITGLVWTLDVGTTYTADCSGNSFFVTFGCGGVIDSKVSNRTVDGDYYIHIGPTAQLGRAAVTTQAACEATPGSWFRSGNTIYVNTIDGRVPDADIRVIPAAQGSGSYSIKDGRFYLEGIRLEGAANTTWKTNMFPSGPVTGRAKDCWFRHALGSDNWAWVNEGNYILQRCVAAKALADGFSIQTQNSVLAHAMEIDCIGRDNGYTPSGLTNQGSTAHALTTTTRVNCEYFKNQTANVHDVSGCKTWMLGVYAHDADVGAVCNIGVGSIVADTDVAYLDCCTTGGFAIDLGIGTGTQCFVNEFLGVNGATPTITGPGAVTAYTPP